MTKMRVYEYAKQLNMTSREIVTILKRLNIPVNNHMSVIDEEAQMKITQFFDEIKRKANGEKMKKMAEMEKVAEKTPVVKEEERKEAHQPAVTASEAEKPAKAHEQRAHEQRANEPRHGSSRQDRGDRGPRPDRGDRGPRQERGDRGPRQERGDRGPRQDRGDRGPRQDRGDRGPRQERGDRGPRQDRGDRGPRPDRGDRGPRPEGGQRSFRPEGARPQAGRGNERRGGLNVPAPAVEEADVPRRRNQPKKAKEKEHEFEESYNKKTKVKLKEKPIPVSLDDDDRGEVVSGKKRNKMKKNRDVVIEKNAETPSKIFISGPMTVGDFAKMIGKESGEIIKKLLLLGVMATINQEIDIDTITLIADEYGIEVEQKVIVNEEEFEQIEEQDDPEQLQERPPVVTIMGHVDHGKTTLLDSIRKTRVAATEAGGITQHIGAYQVEINGKKITFLDTPGHAAFTSMRARGAKVTDITVLVVAADDGVMPQTVEAINHAKAADVPIIVAINKMDKPEANPERVKQELSEYGLIPEEWGGDTIFVPVSALKGEGIQELLEMILLVAEIRELKANPDKRARGTVIEAQLDKGKGPVATVLVQHGTLRVGDPIVAGTAYGKVRTMTDDRGKRIKEAPPSTPVEITGLNSVPQAGDQFMVFESERKAKEIGERRAQKMREQELRKTTVSLDDLFAQIKEGEIKELNIIIKADVQGSVEALRGALEKINVEGVRVRIIHAAVGAITEWDVMLAKASNAIIIGFNVRPDVNARNTAEREKVDIRLHRIIYNVIEEIESAMKGMLDPEYQEKVLGQAEVRQVFKISKVGTVAGCYVTGGKVTRDSEVRVIRDGIVIFEGKIDSLKRFKDDVREVVQGYECGISIQNFNDLKEGDIIEAFVMEQVAR